MERVAEIAESASDPRQDFITTDHTTVLISFFLRCLPDEFPERERFAGMDDDAVYLAAGQFDVGGFSFLE